MLDSIPWYARVSGRSMIAYGHRLFQSVRVGTLVTDLHQPCHTGPWRLRLNWTNCQDSYMPLDLECLHDATESRYAGSLVVVALQQ